VARRRQREPLQVLWLLQPPMPVLQALPAVNGYSYGRCNTTQRCGDLDSNDFTVPTWQWAIR